MIIEKSEYYSDIFVLHPTDGSTGSNVTLSLQRNNDINSLYQNLWMKLVDARGNTMDIVLEEENAELLALAIQALLQEYKTGKRTVFNDENSGT